MPIRSRTRSPTHFWVPPRSDDLGSRYPASDDRWKNADSMMLLQQCANAIREAGYRIENIDATIIVERPKLAPYIESIRANIASRLGLDVSCVSVKAKTSEGMGYTGDGSGIAVHAVALLERSSGA